MLRREPSDFERLTFSRYCNEGAGLSAQLTDTADQRVTIPMPGGTESLNAAAAAAIALFEGVRQNRGLS